jgi:hypothetical protein
MTWEDWSKSDSISLARYVNADAMRLLGDNINYDDLSIQPNGLCLTVQAIYDALRKRKEPINYAPEKYDYALTHQKIRTPGEILGPPHEGTCLDLALLFCALCLHCNLLPILVVLDGHALAVVSLKNRLPEWNRNRAGREPFDVADSDQKGLLTALQPEQYTQFCQLAIDKDGGFLPIECTGFAHSQRLSQQQTTFPETVGRQEDGTLTFERAVQAGQEQLNLQSRRPFHFALDIAMAQANIGEPYALPEGALTSVPQVISGGLFEELKELVRGVDIPVKDLERMYNYSKPPGWTMPPSHDPGEKLLLVLQTLAQAPLQTDDRAPILTFVNCVAKYIHEQLVCDRLHDWVNRAAKSLSTGKVEVECLDTTEKDPEETDPYLLVKFEPINLEQSLFSIGAWCFGDRKGNIGNLDVGEEPYKLEDVPGLLDQLVNQSLNYITNEGNSLTIELFLPFYLLDYNIHQWMLQMDFGQSVSVDDYCPLVVRSWDRLYLKSRGSNTKSYRAWKRNWCILEDYKERHTDLKPQFLSTKDYERDNLVSFLLKVVYVALTFVPQKPPDETQLNLSIFPKIISAGMSIALWPREQSDRLDEQEIQAAYESLLSGCKLDELPKIMWDKRNKADKHDVVHRLTLLWDDPTRLPPEVGSLLGAPQRKGSEQ